MKKSFRHRPYERRGDAGRGWEINMQGEARGAILLRATEIEQVR
jgi:hypothetical protein